MAHIARTAKVKSYVRGERKSINVDTQSELFLFFNHIFSQKAMYTTEGNSTYKFAVFSVKELNKSDGVSALYSPVSSSCLWLCFPFGTESRVENAAAS